MSTGSVKHPKRLKDPKEKKAFSTQSEGSFVETGGDERFAKFLVPAMKAPSQDNTISQSLTHPLHSYPARMHPAIAKTLIEMASQLGPENIETVFDPFVGSGTTLVEASAQGFQCIGLDLNPLAVLLSSVKASPRSKKFRAQLKKFGDQIARKAIDEGKAARRSGYRSPPPFHPPGLSQKKRNAILEGWFSGHVRRELEFIAAEIFRLHPSEPTIANALKICLSAIVNKASLRKSDSDRSKVKKNIGRGAIARWFQHRVALLCEGLSELANEKEIVATINSGNAFDLELPGIKEKSVDVILTSPPYMGTYDYSEHHDLRAAFLGLSLDGMVKGEFGARRHGNKNTKETIENHKKLMTVFFQNIEKILKPGGIAIFVIGDSLIGQSAFRADEFLDNCRGSLKKCAWAWQARHKWGAKEQTAFGDHEKREHVLVYKRVHS